MKLDISKAQLLAVLRSSKELWTDDELQELHEAIEDLGAPPEPKKTTAPRQPNLAFDYIMAVCGFTEVTHAVASRIGRFLREARSATPGAPLAVLKARVEEYRRRYPDCSVTPEALTKHYCALAAPMKQAAPQNLPANVVAILAARKQEEELQRLTPPNQ